MKKEEVRRQAKARKALLSDEERNAAARSVFDFVEKTAAFILADHILMYNSLADELSTREFIDRWAHRKHFYLPRVNGADLEILPYDKSRLHLGAFHIEEPEGDNTVDFNTIELVIVPAMAYDRQGNRVGRGKGFYDRLLSDTHAVTMGVAYSCQLFDEIDTDQFDVAVHYVITESGIIKVS